MKKDWFTLIELLVVLTILEIFVLSFFPLFRVITICPNYGSGTRTGVIYKISKNGLFWKTWEGEMNVGAMSSNGNGIAVPKVWAFSVKEKSLVDELIRRAENGSRVTVKYEQVLVRKVTEGDSRYMVVGIVGDEK